MAINHDIPEGIHSVLCSFSFKNHVPMVPRPLDKPYHMFQRPCSNAKSPGSDFPSGESGAKLPLGHPMNVSVRSVLQ